MYLNYDYAIKTPRGTIITDRNIGEPINKLVNYISTHTSPKDKILLFPEEVLVYFLTERTSATKLNDYLPIRIQTKSEELQFIKFIQTEKINFIAISNRSTHHDYGVPFWGKDYNKLIYNWIQDNYQLCSVFGKYQTTENFYTGYGIKVYQLNCPEN